MLTLLRRRGRSTGDADDAQAPAAGVDRLGELIDRMRAAGVPTELATSGQPRQLPPGLDLCVYRVIQESLTNVLKHAGPASATVSLDYRPDHLIAQVTDNGRGARTADPAGSGHGLPLPHS